MVASARAFVAHSLEARPAVYFQSVWTHPWERDEGVPGASERGRLAAQVAHRVQQDALTKHMYGDEVCEGVVGLGDADTCAGDADGTEGVVAVWMQLKGTAFSLVVPRSANAAVAAHHLAAIIRLLQLGYGYKGFEFEPKDLLMRPEVAHTVLSKALPNGFTPVTPFPILRQAVRKGVDAVK